MDLRKWIAQDGFNNDFLVAVADNADETTASMVTESTASQGRSEAPSPITPEPPTSNAQQASQPAASTPLPKVDNNSDCMTSILDELRQVSISVGDLKDELDAANSKILLRELEHKDLKVISVIF